MDNNKVNLFNNVNMGGHIKESKVFDDKRDDYETLLYKHNLLMEMYEELYEKNEAILKENNIIPKNTTKIVLQIGGKIFHATLD